MSIEDVFEERLDFLFNSAIDVKDTIWYTESETLRDAILNMFCELEAHRTWCNCYDTSQSAKPEQPSHSCTPCIAGIYTPNSKHSGANDCEALENMICPSASQCDDASCLSRRPHAENEHCKNTCLLEPNSRYVGQCIEIPDMWLDKGSNQIMECDPEGMKPKSKYEKADTVRKHVLGENFRDLKE